MKWCLLGWLAVFFSVVAEGGQEKVGQSVLLELAQKLECAQTEQQASLLLAKLAALPTQPFGIPSDNLKANTQALLYAASVDILLQVLYHTIQRYPALQEWTERSVLQWNYCEMFADGKIADLSVDQAGQIFKQQARETFPLKKQGLGLWGFLNPDPRNRYVPKIIQDAAIWPLIHEDLVFRLYQQQCFPHPDTGKLFEEQNQSELPPFGELRVANSLPSSKPYPYFWQPDCRQNGLQKITLAKTEADQKAIIETTKKAGQAKLNAKPIAKQQSELSQGLAISKPSENTQGLNLQQKLTHRPSKAQAKLAQKQTPKTDKPNNALLQLSFQDYDPPKKQEMPAVSPSLGSANANASAPLPLPPKNGYGLAGNFYHRAKLTGTMAVGGSVSWRPFSNFSVRGGVNYSYFPGAGQLSYSWGLGYDDWHPGTFSAQLINWGPILPGEGLAMKKASVNLGYKFIAGFLKPYHLNGSAAINLPISGDPTVSTTWVWSPVGHWFIRASLQKNLVRSDGLNWSYGFGYADSRPYKISITYDNWGINPIFDSKQADALNFQENGAVTLSGSWAF